MFNTYKFKKMTSLFVLLSIIFTTLVGFVEKIDCDAANRWTQDFYLSLLNGFNVDDAITYASGRASSNSGLHSAVSYGDGLYELPI